MVAASLRSLGTYNYLLVAEEQHRDGNTHIHAMVIYEEKKNIKSCHHFCINVPEYEKDGRKYTEYHANLSATKSRKNWITYCKKEDANPIEEGSENGTKDDILQIRKELSYEKWLQYCYEKRIPQYIWNECNKYTESFNDITEETTIAGNNQFIL